MVTLGLPLKLAGLLDCTCSMAAMVGLSSPPPLALRCPTRLSSGPAPTMSLVCRLGGRLEDGRVAAQAKVELRQLGACWPELSFLFRFVRGGGG